MENMYIWLVVQQEQSQGIVDMTSWGDHQPLGKETTLLLLITKLNRHLLKIMVMRRGWGQGRPFEIMHAFGVDLLKDQTISVIST